MVAERHWFDPKGGVAIIERSLSRQRFGARGRGRAEVSLSGWRRASRGQDPRVSGGAVGYQRLTARGLGHPTVAQRRRRTLNSKLMGGADAGQACGVSKRVGAVEMGPAAAPFGARLRCGVVGVSGNRPLGQPMAVRGRQARRGECHRQQSERGSDLPCRWRPGRARAAGRMARGAGGAHGDDRGRILGRSGRLRGETLSESAFLIASSSISTVGPYRWRFRFAFSGAPAGAGTSSMPSTVAKPRSYVAMWWASFSRAAATIAASVKLRASFAWLRN